MEFAHPDIESAYHTSTLGRTLYDQVLLHRPQKILEFGTYFGYTSTVMALALDELAQGHITTHDLYEEYEYRHPTFDITRTNIERHGVAQYVTLRRKGLAEWLRAPEAFDLLYIDVSNNGDVIDAVYDAVKDRIAHGAVVLFEGGSQERDQVEWMARYDKKPFAQARAPYTVIDPNFPSISRLG